MRPIELRIGTAQVSNFLGIPAHLQKTAAQGWTAVADNMLQRVRKCGDSAVVRVQVPLDLSDILDCLPREVRGG